MPSGAVSQQLYMATMWRLYDHKRTLEQMRNEMDTLKHRFPELADVAPELDSMECLLNPLEEEWERVSPQPDELFRFDDLKALPAFARKTDREGSTFGLISESYRNVRGELLALLRRARVDGGGLGDSGASPAAG
jgi:hypothetical protein